MSDADLKPLRRWTRRPLFSPSQMLTAQQLNALIDDQRAHSEMLMRALHGHGVIFGYAVKLSERRRLAGRSDLPADQGPNGSTKLKISCGMALDRHGRLLHWPDGILDYSEIVNETKCPGTFILSVHYAERRSPKGGCGPCGEKPEWIEDGVVFTLTKECAQPDRSCPVPDAQACVSWDEYICARTGSGSSTLDAASDLDTACLDPRALCPIECSDDAYDPRSGIPIACVEIVDLAGRGCEPVWGFFKVTRSCEIRPYVYRTPLLYELAKGCQDNLARVESLSWQHWCMGIGQHDWEYRVPWREFAELFPKAGALTITFDRPILSSTVNRGSIFFTALRRDKEADYVITRRIPANLEPVKPGKFARTFRIEINPAWVRNEIRTGSYLRNGGRIELTIRGQMLRDQCGNMLDAVPIGYRPGTPKLKRPGGDFTAMFRFAEAPRTRRRSDEDED